MINIKHFPFYLGLSFTALALICQLPASAQRGNQSDVTGAIVTTSDITGGTFSRNQSDVTGASVTTSDIRSGIFSPTGRGRGTQVEFTKSSVRIAVNQTAGKILNELNINSLTSLAGNPIPSGTQQTLLNVLTASGSVQAGSGLTNALTSVQDGPPAIQAQQLANSLRGLFKTKQAKANGRVNPTRLVAAVKAYNNLIDNSSAQFLNNPPPELQAIQSVLLQLINSASSQRR